MNKIANVGIQIPKTPYFIEANTDRLRKCENDRV